MAAGTTALAIVHGPQAYVSPAWYPSKARHGRVVPTWNYVTVHFTGPLTVHRDPEWLRDVVTRLTQRHETRRREGAGSSGAAPWAVTDAPPDYINGQLRGIVGVELTIATVEAKHKLSQNRGADDRAAVAEALRAEPGPGAGRDRRADVRQVSTGLRSALLPAVVDLGPDPPVVQVRDGGQLRVAERRQPRPRPRSARPGRRCGRRGSPW